MSISESGRAGPIFYDVAEVAAIFKMSRMTVYRAIASGELRAVRIRGRWLVPTSVIEALVTEATARPSAPPQFASETERSS